MNLNQKPVECVNVYADSLRKCIRLLTRTEEALQTWQTISSLCNDLISSNRGENLQNLQNYVIDAETNYTALLESGFSDSFEANIEYLSALKESITAFKELAEIP